MSTGNPYGLSEISHYGILTEGPVRRWFQWGHNLASRFQCCFGSPDHAQLCESQSAIPKKLMLKFSPGFGNLLSLGILLNWFFTLHIFPIHFLFPTFFSDTKNHWKNSDRSSSLGVRLSTLGSWLFSGSMRNVGGKAGGFINKKFFHPSSLRNQDVSLNRKIERWWVQLQKKRPSKRIAKTKVAVGRNSKQFGGTIFLIFHSSFGGQ